MMSTAKQKVPLLKTSSGAHSDNEEDSLHTRTISSKRFAFAKPFIEINHGSLLNIFSFLKKEENMALGATCKKLYKISINDDFWRRYLPNYMRESDEIPLKRLYIENFMNKISNLQKQAASNRKQKNRRDFSKASLQIFYFILWISLMMGGLLLGMYLDGNYKLSWWIPFFPLGFALVPSYFTTWISLHVTLKWIPFVTAFANIMHATSESSSSHGTATAAASAIDSAIQKSGVNALKGKKYHSKRKKQTAIENMIESSVERTSMIEVAEEDDENEDEIQEQQPLTVSSEVDLEQGPRYSTREEIIKSQQLKAKNTVEMLELSFGWLPVVAASILIKNLIFPSASWTFILVLPLIAHFILEFVKLGLQWYYLKNPLVFFYMLLVTPSLISMALVSIRQDRIVTWFDGISAWILCLGFFMTLCSLLISFHFLFQNRLARVNCWYGSVGILPFALSLVLYVIKLNQTWELSYIFILSPFFGLTPLITLCILFHHMLCTSFEQRSHRRRFNKRRKQVPGGDVALKTIHVGAQ